MCCCFVDRTDLLFALRKWTYNRALYAGPFLKWPGGHEIKAHCLAFMLYGSHQRESHPGKKDMAAVTLPGSTVHGIQC